MGHDPVLTQSLAQSRIGNPKSGQAIVMVTLAMFAMFGVLGLAVDFGWAYFVKRSAQGAADSAAIATAEEMRRMTGVSGPYPCLGGGGVCRDDTAPFVCLSTVTSITTDNLDNGCLYARQNGFQEVAPQRVRISEGSNSAPPTLPGVTLQYWATVRVTESVPQLFAAITGNPIATVSARATAGLYQGQVRGSIILLNRDNDVAVWGGGNPTGANLDVQGSANVTAGGGILMASGCNGGCAGGTHAGNLQGNTASVTATYTNIRGTGDAAISGGNQARWAATPQNGFLEGSEFQDPTRKKTQIPVSDAGLQDCGIVGGVISPVSNGGTIDIGPGNYYATFIDGKGNKVPTGNPIQFSGNVNFRAGGSCLTGTSNATGFGTYVMYGGISTKSGGGATNLNFEPGKIVLAGATPTNNGDANPLFDMSVGGSAFSLTGSGPTSSGNAFIFTDQHYPGLTSPPTRLSTSTAYQTMKQGETGFKSGNNQQVSFTLDGLNQAGAGFPTDLKPYNGVVMWQDRRNSSVLYDTDGTYGCAAPYLNCTKTNQNLITDGVASGSQGMFIAAGASTVIRGVIYQPRGSWVTLQGSPGMSAALQLISGAIKVQGSGTVNLQPVTSGLPISIVGLVE